MTLSIIIPTLNNTLGLKKNLRHLKNLHYEVIIIDNQPTEKNNL